MEVVIRIQHNGKNQQFRWKNDKVDDLSNCLENFKALMEFKDKHFDNDRSILIMIDKHNITGKKLCKNYDGFRLEELPKIAYEADQTDLEKQGQNIREAEKQI